MLEVFEGIDFPGEIAQVNTHLHPGYHHPSVLVQAVIWESPQIKQAC